MLTIHILVLAAAVGVSADEASAPLDKLRNEAMWRDATRKEELAKCLELLKARCPLAAIPVLVQHIDYDACGHNQPVSLITANMRYPCYDVLPALGLAAVQSLLDEYKRLEGDKKVRNVALTRAIIIWSLIDIYNQGGQGKSMVKLRLELEAKKSPGDAALFKQAIRDHLSKD